jgi:hypothetical protein
VAELLVIQETLSKIRQLARKEVVEIHLDQVATLSDQCFANYMLYYVFFHRKIISLSEVLETGYKYFPNGVIKAVNTILSLFESEETRTYCKQEILKVWDNLQKNQDLCYEEYVRDFHVFRPEEAFLLAKKKIDNIQNEEIDICSIDFSKNVFCTEKATLEFLTGYKFSDYIDYVVELLLDYCGKTNKTLVSGCNWLKDCYGIDVDSYKYMFCAQKQISAHLLKAVSNGNDIAMAVGYQWAKYALAFNFNPTGRGRKSTIKIYYLELKNSEGIKEYRGDCWKILITLAAKEEWQDKVIMVLDEYARNLQGMPDRDIVIGDVEAIEQLLLVLDSKRISFLKCIQRLLCNFDKMNVVYNKKWIEKLTGKLWELYQLFENNIVSSELEYEDYETQRRSRIIDYGKKLSKSEINDWVQSINEILSDNAIDHDVYAINEGIELVVQQFEEDCLYEFLNALIQFGTNISIRPWTVLKALNKSRNSLLLLSSLQEADFPQKNDWLFYFFDTLPEGKINSKMLKKFLCFLKSDSDKSINSSPFRSLRVLDKFICIEPNIYPISCSVIFEKRKYSNFIVKIYFKLLFQDQVYSPKELLSLFQSDMNLLQEIYFYMLRVDEFADYTGTFLQVFLSQGEIWLQKYSEVFWENATNRTGYGFERNYSLWKSENYLMYYDYLFYNIPEGEIYSLSSCEAFGKVLAHKENDDYVTNRQLNWLTHIIVDNAQSERISIIFEIVRNLNEGTHRHAIKTFLDYNSDFDTFKQLPLVPNLLCSSGSFIPVYQKQIEFLESLYPYVPGVKYLKHKAKIKGMVECFIEMIKKEETEEIYRKLYL